MVLELVNEYKWEMVVNKVSLGMFLSRVFLEGCFSLIYRINVC